jgi:hypothetical protein
MDSTYSLAAGLDDVQDWQEGEVNERREKKADTGASLDPGALVQAVLRESYLQTTEDLRFYAEKVRHFNRLKKAVREYLSALREFRANALSAARERGADLCRGDKKDMAILAKAFAENARAHEPGEAELELCIPDRVPAAAVNSAARLDDEIARWEEKLNTIGDDAQLANVDLQNVLQKQQQTLQMMSNISKLLHDTSMAVIRKIGGG